jgi:hypothetical protein
MAMLLLDRAFTESLLATEKDLDLRNVEAKIWPQVLSECRAEKLRLYHITLPSLDGIECLASVEHLVLEWAPKILEISSVFKLHNLRALSIFDFSRLRRIDGIQVLRNLVELNLSGSRGALTPRLKLASVAPVSGLQCLESFSLANAQLDDDDIAVLSNCKNLKHLDLSRQFERGQVAFLAKCLNAQLAEPLTAGLETTLECETCGGRKFMFHGRRMPILCRTCEPQRFDRYQEEFWRLARVA